MSLACETLLVGYGHGAWYRKRGFPVVDSVLKPYVASVTFDFLLRTYYLPPLMSGRADCCHWHVPVLNYS